jgi:hypothetical protein
MHWMAGAAGWLAGWLGAQGRWAARAVTIHFDAVVFSTHISPQDILDQVAICFKEGCIFFPALFYALYSTAWGLRLHGAKRPRPNDMATNRSRQITLIQT